VRHHLEVVASGGSTQRRALLEFFASGYFALGTTTAYRRGLRLVSATMRCRPASPAARTRAFRVNVLAVVPIVEEHHHRAGSAAIAALICATTSSALASPTRRLRTWAA
jgi:hypothetical protein